VAILSGRKVTLKEAKNQIRYKNVCIEMQQMWNKKCMIIPGIIEGIGIATDCLKV
jgi:hypothetical protein